MAGTVAIRSVSAKRGARVVKCGTRALIVRSIPAAAAACAMGLATLASTPTRAWAHRPHASALQFSKAGCPFRAKHAILSGEVLSKSVPSGCGQAAGVFHAAASTHDTVDSSQMWRWPSCGYGAGASHWQVASIKTHDGYGFGGMKASRWAS